jgi:hypothetical protein
MWPFAKKNPERYVLVVSWGGMRWFYGLWITKAIEELWLREKIDAVFWVSAWWLLASYWAAGFDPDECLDIFFSFWFYESKEWYKSYSERFNP